MCEPILHNVSNSRTVTDTALKESPLNYRKKAKHILSN